MDQTTVPKVINRHVCKALAYLQSLKSGFRTREEITLRVHYTMRHNKPIRNMEMIVQQSLFTLTNCGMLACTGANSYCIRSTLLPASEFPTQNAQAQMVQGQSEVNRPQTRPCETRIQRAQIRRSPIRNTPRLGVANNSHAINRRLSMARRFSILRFPESNRFELCNECVSVTSRFTQIYRELLRSSRESYAANAANTEEENNDDDSDDSSDDINDTSDDNEMNGS